MTHPPAPEFLKLVKAEDPFDGATGEPLALSGLGWENIEGIVQEASVSGSVSRDTVSELFPKRTVTPELLHVGDQQASPAALQNAPRLSEVMNAREPKDVGDDGLPDSTIRLSSGDSLIPGALPRRVRRALRRGALGNHEFDFGTTDPSIHNVIELSHM